MNARVFEIKQTNDIMLNCVHAWWYVFYTIHYLIYFSGENIQPVQVQSAKESTSGENEPKRQKTIDIHNVHVQLRFIINMTPDFCIIK